MKNSYSPQRVLSATALILSLTFAPLSFADNDLLAETSSKSSEQIEKIKTELMTKLSKINYINASFSQTVVSDLGEVLQEGKGTIAISKPDLVNWHTQEPDETLIVSDGKSLWFYDPFIEQVTLYSFTKSIANTPVLLLTSEDPKLWDDFQVSQSVANSYVITSLNDESQIKSLTLTFKADQLQQLTILDSTGQSSHITLQNVDFTTKPDESLFNFVIPEGVVLDDQR
ncbi:outer membrane lipoprotein chaperone LolA [Thalassotalea piscium]